MIEQLLYFAGVIYGDQTGSDGRGAQALYDAPGTYQWTCPDNVTSISVMVVSAGQQGRFPGASTTQMVAGAGGNTRYRNNIPVVPGQVYTIKVGNGGTTGSVPAGTAMTTINDYLSSAFEIVAGLSVAESTTVTGDVGGRNGAAGLNGNVSSGTYGGGYSATFTSNGTQQGAAGISANGVNWLNARYGLGNSLDGSPMGGGGSCRTTGDNGSKFYGRGGNGGVKIIWGKGRAWPTTSIADV